MTSFVSDIILPPLSVILPLNANLDLKFAVLQPGPHYQQWGGYNTIDQAQEDGAVIMAYVSRDPFSLSFPCTRYYFVSSQCTWAGGSGRTFTNMTMSLLSVSSCLF